MSSDDERPKKSWREIDAMRDKSRQRRDEAPRGKRDGETSAAYRSYKSQLNRLFDGGAVPEALKSKVDVATPQEATSRKAALHAIIDAPTPNDTLQSLDAYRAAHGFPDQEDVLVKLLDVPDERVMAEAMGALKRLHEEGRLRRGASVKARVRTAQMTVDDPRVQAAAKELLEKL